MDGWTGGTYDAICTWEEDAETEQTEQRPTNHPEDTESCLKVKYNILKNKGYKRRFLKGRVHPKMKIC